jgi:DNA helicase II / ATP-dependent DNA helicase PcrA
MRNQGFTEFWESLSEIQREAAEWESTAVLALAGPGSGKTRVLTCRIARILELSPDQNFRVLGLTFTNKAADEMRSRLESMFQGKQSRLFLGTFHSFCADVLRQHGAHLGIQPNFQIYSDDLDLQAILGDAVKKAMRTSTVVSELDRKTLPVIKRLKSLLVPADRCRENFRDPEFGERMAAVYPAYEAELANRNALDFESLIYQAHRLFTKFPALAKRYRTIYQDICVDEFQDTNFAQYALIRALTGDKFTRIFVVADDDQVIYQWNGASHKRLEEFVTDYAPRVIQLPMNYRCPPEIVALANNLIRHNFLRTANKRPLAAYRPSPGGDIIRLLPSFLDEESEAAGIAADIARRHGLKPDGIVVLARTRKLLNQIESALRADKIAVVKPQRKSDFESTPFQWLHSILRLANDRQSRSNLDAVSGSFAQLTGVEVDPEEVVARAQTQNRDFLQQWIKLARENASEAATMEMLDQTDRCLGEGRNYKVFCNFALTWFKQLASAKSSTGDPTNEPFALYDEEREVWNELFREISTALGGDSTLGAFLQELQMRSKESLPKSGAVLLMTIHGAKGKEFDHVYLAGLVEDELPSFQSRQKGDQSPEMEEERRSCFVAVTRTIKTLTLSYARRYRGWPKEPSRFLFEMGLLQLQGVV